MSTAVMNNVYNHFLTAYTPKGINSPYDTHKKSELRGVYNSIVKLNKESPLAILDTSKDAQEFAVNMKENARSLRNSIISISGRDTDTLLNKKIAFSSNESLATASYIGDIASADDAPSFTLEIKNLASAQVNTGNYLPNEKVNLPADNYSFDIGINNLNYEFQFRIGADDTNRSVQDRLARLVNDADIGLEASVLEDGNGNSALKLASKAVGLRPGQEDLFHISEENTSRTSGAVSYLGIGDITRPATNAQFLINGNERTAYSNNFTIEKTYEIHLTGLSTAEGDTTTVGIKPDHESLHENISQLIGGYNDFLRSAAEYLNTQPRSNRLIQELRGIANTFSGDLAPIGINIGEDGALTLNEKLLDSALSTSDAEETLSPIKDFTTSLLRKTKSVSLNPMHYVNKTIVAYKNPGHGYASPYVTSAYSGMMFNSYC